MKFELEMPLSTAPHHIMTCAVMMVMPSRLHESKQGEGWVVRQHRELIHTQDVWREEGTGC